MGGGSEKRYSKPLPPRRKLDVSSLEPLFPWQRTVIIYPVGHAGSHTSSLYRRMFDSVVIMFSLQRNNSCSVCLPLPGLSFEEKHCDGKKGRSPLSKCLAACRHLWSISGMDSEFLHCELNKVESNLILADEIHANMRARTEVELKNE